MYAKDTILSAGLIAGGLLGCTTPQPPEPAATVPPPEISIDLPLEPPPKSQDLKSFKTCLLGSTQNCMAMDPHPFEPCLVTTRTCDRTGAEMTPIAPPVHLDPSRDEPR